MSGAEGARRPQRSGGGGGGVGGGGGGGTLPAHGFTYIGGDRHQPLTLNNGAPAYHLNNGSLRSLPDKKNNRGAVCHPENFQRNVDSRYSRKQENGYLRNSETIIGFGRKEREYERAHAHAHAHEYSEPEYSVIPESYDYPRACSHSNTFNC